MTRRYQSIWAAISTANVGAPVIVTVHYSAVKTLRQAVSKEKSRETAIKRKLGLPFAGKLIVKESEPDSSGRVKIEFRLDYDNRRL